MNPLCPVWLQLMQRRVAFCSIGPTTLRRMGANRRNICDFLSKFDLSTINRENFDHKLNELTECVKIVGGCSFGPARKAVNLFLRDCLYNFALRDSYKLGVIEKLMEVPLDGQIMRIIRAENVNLAHSAVIHLEQGLSDEYQTEAAILAEGMSIHRVHLDLKWWNQN